MTQFIAICLGGIFSALLLSIAHLKLWDIRPNLPIVARYTIGVACLNLGVTLTGVLLEAWLLPITVWTIAGAGGAVVGGLHLRKHIQDAPFTINLLHRALSANGRGVGDGAWEARESDD